MVYTQTKQTAKQKRDREGFFLNRRIEKKSRVAPQCKQTQQQQQILRRHRHTHNQKGKKQNEREEANTTKKNEEEEALEVKPEK